MRCCLDLLGWVLWFYFLLSSLLGTVRQLEKVLVNLLFLGGYTGLPDLLDCGLQGAMFGLMLTMEIMSPLLGSGWSPGHLPVLSFAS